MRFTEVIVSYMAIVTILMIVICGITNCNKLEKEIICKRNQAVCVKFVSESFRKTCEGKGFKNLNEWQKCCKALWKFDYISWADAQDLLDIGTLKSDEKMFYGKWSGNVCEGEVFCRYVITDKQNS